MAWGNLNLFGHNKEQPNNLLMIIKLNKAKNTYML